ncbi:MAG: NDP-sugar synthase [Elusimicrobiota bacterium]|jgi:NDP-sugar pyrophosphorylase family protein
MNTVRWGGIIAAGEGSRLAPGYPDMPKPLVEVSGRPLIAWAAASLRAAGVRRLVVLLNSKGDAARDWLRRNPQGLSIRFLRKDTASSWESFRLVSRTLARYSDRFLLSTTDTVMSPSDARRFAQEAFKHRAQAALALTRFVDDEKPLWADVSQKGAVTALGDGALRRQTVTCGVYALRAAAARAMPPAETYTKLRDFWSSLLDSGVPVRGVVLSDTVDVDRPEDVGTAERLIARRSR